MGVSLRFLDAEGEFAAAVVAPVGARLLDVAQAAGQPLEGTCNGQMACSTCHVILDAAAFDQLPPPTVEEEDLLDLVPGVDRFSRLACQVNLRAGLDALTVRLPLR